MISVIERWCHRFPSHALACTREYAEFVVVVQCNGSQHYKLFWPTHPKPERTYWLPRGELSLKELNSARVLRDHSGRDEVGDDYTYTHCRFTGRKPDVQAEEIEKE